MPFYFRKECPLNSGYLIGLIPQWVTLEPRVFGWMDRLCEDYCGGIWNLYTLNNGGAFMAPNRMTMMTKHGYCSMP